jgi:DNA-binding transcriptional MocR family regulator
MVENQLSARVLEARLGEWRGGGSAYRALADRIRLLTLDGRIPTDSRLPAERDLSARLGVSRTTVTAAYRELREAGYLVSVRGSGSVARLPGRAPTPSAVAGSGILDFSKATMPAFPGLADAALRAARDLPGQLGGSGFDPVGIPELRAAIADRYRARGLSTHPEQIMVTIGAQHAIALLSRLLIGRGDRVLIEMPTYPHAYEALNAAGARLMPVSVSAGSPNEDAALGGWDETALLQTLRRSNPVLGYLMPDFHNPTGRTMPALQRERVLAAAARQRNLSTCVRQGGLGFLSWVVDAGLAKPHGRRVPRLPSRPAVGPPVVRPPGGRACRQLGSAGLTRLPGLRRLEREWVLARHGDEGLAGVD